MNWFFSLDWFFTLAYWVGAIIAAVILVAIFIFFRRVVPTNMVHIVQRSKSTTAYGRGKDSGNVYYAWPSWVPRFGVVKSVRTRAISPI